jgi:hypothetical protein
VSIEFPCRKALAFLCLASLSSVAAAENPLAEGMREIEEFRMRQLQAVQAGAEISPFTTDGCSGSQSKSWEILAGVIPAFADEFGDRPPWEACCVAHDKLYWQGRVDDGYNRRVAADRELEACVVATGDRLAPELGLKYDVSEERVRDAFTQIADWMYGAVRIGGQPCSFLPWRWGYGWPSCAFTAAADAPPGISDIEADETVVFFDTAAWLDSEYAQWNIPVHAWIYEPQASVVRKGLFATVLEKEYGLAAGPESQAFFDRRVNLLIADNERGKTLVVRIAGQDITLPPSEPNGHVSSVLQIPADLVDSISERGHIRFYALTAAHETRRFEAEVRLVPPGGVSIVSDIDDTVKISQVTDRKLLLENTFYKPFEAVPGMPELYRDLAAAGAELHFVSSSPWQLYEPLRDFLDEAGFPWATMSLKSFRFRDETLLNLFKKGNETKPAQIVPILEKYPGRKFILIGDSGEQDPEVYGDIARRYPHAIQRILIRNLDGAGRDDARYLDAFENVPGHQWRLFDDPGQLAASDLTKRE